MPSGQILTLMNVELLFHTSVFYFIHLENGHDNSSTYPTDHDIMLIKNNMKTGTIIGTEKVLFLLSNIGTTV